MKVNRELVERMGKMEIPALCGMLFNIQSNLYVLSCIEVSQPREIGIPKYCLINVNSFHRWTDAGVIGEICETLERNHAEYLGNISNLGDCVMELEKNTWLIDDINKSKLVDCREVANDIDINTSYEMEFLK